MKIIKKKLDKFFTLKGQALNFVCDTLPRNAVRKGCAAYYIAIVKGAESIEKIRKFNGDQKNAFLKAMNMSIRFEGSRVVLAKYSGFQIKGEDILHAQFYFEKEFKDFARFLGIEKNKAIARRELIALDFLKQLGRLVMRNLKNVSVVRNLKKGIAEEAFEGHEKILNKYIDTIIASGKVEMANFADIGYRHFAGTGLADDLKNKIVKNGVAKITRDAQKSTASVFKTVRGIISNSIEETTLKEGISFTDLIDAIQEKVGTTSALRAKVIAQTELNDIANFAAMEGAIEGGATHKQWIWSGIARDSHAEIDGQTVPIDEPFVIQSEDGPVEAQWPGDPNLPPGERINCACSMIPLTLAVEKSERSSLERDIKILKADDEKRLVYGIVYEPDVIDAHGDFATAEEIETAAHDFMVGLSNRRSTGLSFMHEKGVPGTDALIVESFVAQEGTKLGQQTITKGTWVMAAKIFNDDLWTLIKEGKINGFSFQGTATAQAA